MRWKLSLIALTFAAALLAVGAGPALADPPWERGGQRGNDGSQGYYGEPGYGSGGDGERAERRRERRSDQEHAREAVREGKILPLGRVLANVQRAYPGRLLDAELVDGGGRPVYLIKMMTRDGIALVSADAATGRVLGYRQGGR